MTTSNTRQSVSRRTALAGLGAGGLGIALAATARQTSAQDATATANHPVVGLWQNVSAGPDAVDLPFNFSLFHGDGTYTLWGGLDVGAALGIWRPTGERTAELLLIYQDTDPTMTTETPGTATFRMTVDVDEPGTTLASSNGTLDLRSADGSPIFNTAFDAGTSARITFEHNPATGSTAATPTAATPTT